MFSGGRGVDPPKPKIRSTAVTEGGRVNTPPPAISEDGATRGADGGTLFAYLHSLDCFQEAQNITGFDFTLYVLLRGGVLA